MLAAAAAHWLGPLPLEPAALETWRTGAQSHALPLLQYKSVAAPVSTLPIPPGNRLLLLATNVVTKTLFLRDAELRTWFNVDHRTGRGYLNHLLELIANTTSPAAMALLQRVVLSARIAPYSRADAAYLIARASGCVADGADEAVVAMVSDRNVSEWGRNPLLNKCTGALGAHALDGLLAALQDPSMRADAAQNLKAMPGGEADDEIRTALQAALQAESRDWVAATVANTLVGMGNTDAATIEALQPWEAMDIRWEQRGITAAEVARQLTNVGVMNPITDEELAAIQYKDGESLVLNLLGHGGKEDARLAYSSIRDNGYDPRHDELFASLAHITRPRLEVESVSQTRHEFKTEQTAASARLMTWQYGSWKPTPQHLLAGVTLTSFEGTTCTVCYRYHGVEYGFIARPNGTWMDVASVLRAFNAIMQQIGREERAFRLADSPRSNGEYAIFLCAKGMTFRQIAESLHIPLAEET